MTKEMKYGVLALIALAVLVPTVFIIINASVSILQAIIEHPAAALSTSVAFVIGMFLGEKLNK